jgi:hypothetical protein
MRRAVGGIALGVLLAAGIAVVALPGALRREAPRAVADRPVEMLAAPLPSPLMMVFCESCRGRYLFRERGADLRKMRAAFNAILIDDGDNALVEAVQAAGMAAILAFDDKERWVAEKSVAGRVNRIVAQVRAHPGTIAAIYVADRLNERLTPEQQLGYLAATAGQFHRRIPGVPILADVEDWELTCGSAEQANCSSLAKAKDGAFRYETNAVLERLYRSGYLDGMLINDNLLGRNSAVQQDAWRVARALLPLPFLIVSRTAELSFARTAFPGAAHDAVALVEAFVDAPLEGGADGISLWAWHRPWVNETGVLELRTFLNKDGSDTPLWAAMTQSAARYGSQP